MSKSVLETIREYTRDPNRDRAIRTADLELDLCDRMVEMREEAGLTQRQLGQELGFTQGYVAKLENGGYDRCGIGTLRTFALVLGYDIDLDHFFVRLTRTQKRRVLISALEAGCADIDAGRVKPLTNDLLRKVAARGRKRVAVRARKR